MVPAETELLPQYHLAKSLELKMVVLNHTLHVEGYKLDVIQGYTPILDGDEINILRNLWKFKSKFNRNRPYPKDTLADGEIENPSFRRFVKMCQTLSSKDDYGIAHPRQSILHWAAKSNTEDNFPSSVIECLQCWDILMWHAFKIGSEIVAEKLAGKGSGILPDIFSSNLSGIFQKILATEFIGDCVFDWQSVECVLECLAKASPWSDPESSHWRSMAETLSEQAEKNLVTDVNSFLDSLQSPSSEDDLSIFDTLCILILLDASFHKIFIRTLDTLKSAGALLHNCALGPVWKSQVDDLASRDELVAARVRLNATVRAHFSGRSLFWTRQGFHGLTAPGTERCEGADVLLLDGLSFPMMAKDYNEEKCTGRLLGCTIVRGVELMDREAKTPKLSEGLELGEKRLFKVT